MEEEKVIKFYRSNGKYGCFSNLYPCEVEVDGIKFKSSEHAYQYAKANDPIIKQYIKDAPTPALACIVGHGLFPWMVVKDWNKLKVDRMRDVLYAKFEEGDLFGELMATADYELIEDSKNDSFWGCGKDGKGQNMLGKLLMEIREEFKYDAQMEKYDPDEDVYSEEEITAEDDYNEAQFGYD